jgi:PAS domain S-box-containing protein
MAKQTTRVFQPNTDIIAKLIRWFVVGFAGVLLISMLIWQFFVAPATAHEFNFNVFALLSLASLISNFVAFVFVVRIKDRTDSLMWFGVFLTCLMVWASGEILVRLSATPATQAFWGSTVSLGSDMMPAVLFMFALSYTDPKAARQPLLLSLLGAASIIFIYADIHSSGLITHYSTNPKSTPWGFVNASGPAYLLLALWIILLSAASLALLVRFRRHTIVPTLRRQARLFAIGLAVPLVGGGITDGLLPALHVTILPPLTVSLLTLMGIIICYGIYRYRMFSFTPELIAIQILDTMGEAVIGVDPNFKIQYVNPGATQLLGYSAPQLAARSLGELFVHPQTSAQLHQELVVPLGKQPQYTKDAIEVKAANGRALTTTLSITPAASDDASHGYLIVLADITVIARAKQEVEHQVAVQTKTIRTAQVKLVASISSLQQGFLLVHTNGVIELTNHRAATLLHMSEDQMIGHTLLSLDTVTKWGKDLMQVVEHVFKTLHAQRFDAVDTEGAFYRIYITPVLLEGKPIGATIVIEDQTEQKILDRSKDEFFSIASHELRTPLTAIRGNMSMAKDYFPDAMKDKGLNDLVSDAHAASVRLIEIVNDFLDSSKLEQGKMVFTIVPISIAPLITAVQGDLQVLIAQQENVVTLDPSLWALPRVMADEGRLRQILYNLLSNANKYSQHGTVTISGSVHGKIATLHVADTGKGISLENQKLLFHKFQQAGESILTRDNTKGTGLGLYISKLLATNMHGMVELERSEEGVGSVFAMSLPVAKSIGQDT